MSRFVFDFSECLFWDLSVDSGIVDCCSVAWALFEGLPLFFTVTGATKSLLVSIKLPLSVGLSYQNREEEHSSGEMGICTSEIKFATFL